MVGQAGSDPPPHTSGAVTVTVQVYSPAEEIVTGIKTELVTMAAKSAATDVLLKSKSNLISAPEIFIFKIASQVKNVPEPRVAVGFERERDADVITSPGTERKPRIKFDTLCGITSRYSLNYK